MMVVAPSILPANTSSRCPQWMAVIGFLPAIYAGAGVPAGWNALLTALAAAMNIVGNIAGESLGYFNIEEVRSMK